MDMSPDRPDPRDALQGSKYHPHGLFDSKVAGDRRGADASWAPYTPWEARDRTPAWKLGQEGARARLLEIIEVEGPVLLARAFRLCDQKPVSKRVSKRSLQLLELILDQLTMDREVIVVAEPGGRVLHTPRQSSVCVRRLGARPLREVPPSEIGSVMLQLGTDLSDEKALLRDALHAYGLKDLNREVKQILNRGPRWIAAR